MRFLNTITDADKTLLISGACTIETKLIISTSKLVYTPTDSGFDVDLTDPTLTILTQDNSVKTWEEIEDKYAETDDDATTGFVGQFIARTLSGELHNISDDFNIENKYILLCMGIRTMTQNPTTTWYSLGSFLVSKPEDNDVKDNTNYDAFDLTVLFNKAFDADYTDSTFTTSFNDTIENSGSFTAKQLAEYVCSQVGVTFGTASFTNDSFVIDTNQYVGGESCRYVMKDIAKLAYGWCEIGWDDVCYIKNINTSNVISNYDKLTNDNYYSLTYQKNQYGAVNSVYVGLSAAIGEGVEITNPAILPIGTEKIQIGVYDNNLTFTSDRRESVINGGSILFGIQYTPVDEMVTPGHPWLDANKLIEITTMSGGKIYTYPLSKIISYTGHIKTTIGSVGKTKAETNTGFNDSLYKEIKRTYIVVDKQNNTITEYAGKIEALDTRENNNYQATLAKFQSYDPSIAKIDTIERNVTTLQTSTYTKTEVQQIANGTGVDGVKVSAVISTSGTFDENGMTYEKTNAKTKTTINEVGVNVKDSSNKSLLFAGYVDSNNTDYPDYAGQTIVGTDNIIVKNYLNIGNHSRIQDYEDGIGVFYIGGGI